MITTGPRTKKLEKEIAEWIGVNKCVCLNSQTACAEMALRVLGIGPGDEVITSAYTYTASASVIDHVGAKIVMVDCLPDSFDIDYDQVDAAITEKTKAIIPIDIGGKPCDYDRLYEIVEKKRAIFKPSTDIQKAIGRVAICADCAHSFGATRNGVMAGALADFSSISDYSILLSIYHDKKPASAPNGEYRLRLKLNLLIRFLLLFWIQRVFKKPTNDFLVFCGFFPKFVKIS